MSDQHTPGPWTFARLDTTGHDNFAKYVEQTILIGSPDDYFIVLGQKPNGPADICHTGNGPTSAANGRLIAAAPELLQELREFHDHAIDQDFHDCDGIPGGCPVAAAIAKAEGRS